MYVCTLEYPTISAMDVNDMRARLQEIRVEIQSAGAEKREKINSIKANIENRVLLPNVPHINIYITTAA